MFKLILDFSTYLTSSSSLPPTPRGRCLGYPESLLLFSVDVISISLVTRIPSSKVFIVSRLPLPLRLLLPLPSSPPPFPSILLKLSRPLLRPPVTLLIPRDREFVPNVCDDNELVLGCRSVTSVGTLATKAAKKPSMLPSVLRFT